MKTAQLVGNKIIMFLNLFGPENKYFVSSANASDVEGTMAPPPNVVLAALRLDTEMR